MINNANPHANQSAAQLNHKILRSLLTDPAIYAPGVMEKVGGFLGDMATLLPLVARSGLTLKSFRTDKALGFYFDVYKGSQSLGAISKGWDDPGTRVLDLLYINNEQLPALKAKLFEIVSACASQGCCFLFHPSKNSGVELELWTPVYGDRLQPRALKAAFRALAECRRRIGLVCDFSRRSRQ